MAKIKKCKLSWTASRSNRTTGYKIYWSIGNEVNYDSRFIRVGKVTELMLPNDVTLSDGPIMFGITAFNKEGNESDMTKISEPYRLHVPPAPTTLSLVTMDDFNIVDEPRPVTSHSATLPGRIIREKGGKELPKQADDSAWRHQDAIKIYYKSS
jgi:hypothetical protein